MSLSRPIAFRIRFKEVMSNMRANPGIFKRGWINTTRAQARDLAKRIARSDIREFKLMDNKREEENNNAMS